MSGKTDSKPTPPGALWYDAAAFAERAHAGQTRRDGRTPYAAHVARVAMTVSAVFGCDDEQTLAIAWLHDTFEDTTTDFEDLLERFGETVAREVAALSKNPALPSEQRESAYDEGLAAASWRAKIVKLADVIDNMHDSLREHWEDSGGPGRARLVDRAERALRIAEADGGDRPEMTRACEAVRETLAIYPRGR